MKEILKTTVYKAIHGALQRKSAAIHSLFFLIISGVLLNVVTFSCAYAKEGSFTPQKWSAGFTQDDRDRLIRLETKVEEGQKSLQKQIDDLKTFMFWGFGILFGGMGILIGFVIWDRRTALRKF